MALSSALLLSLSLAAGSERILLCRPAVTGDQALARADAVATAGRALASAYLDYGVPCETEAEAGRAAARAALTHGVFTRAEGRVDGSAYTLALVEPAREDPVARRSLVVPPGADPVGPLSLALKELDASIPRPPPRWPTVAGWTLMGVGVAALVGGTVLVFQARDEARRADRAVSPGEYRTAYRAWQRRSGAAGIAFAAGGVALGAGLVLKVTF
jgi:hypothetical protein